MNFYEAGEPVGVLDETTKSDLIYESVLDSPGGTHTYLGAYEGNTTF